MDCPAVLVSASASGQGKTMIAAAMAAAWRNQGLTVRAFKCGPDFIDSMILQEATGHPVYNLDLGMCGLEDGNAQLQHAAQQADVILLEGVMGLYDGVPSTADIAQAFNIPTALVIDASGMAQTFAAIAHGLYQFEPSLIQAGVIANKVGSAGHAKMLADCLGKELTWLGALPRDENFALPERHLGLHLADEIHDLSTRIEAAAAALTANDKLKLPPAVSFNQPAVQRPKKLLEGKTIAVARDAAFCFIYPANIDCLTALGATVVYFSLLDAVALPPADAYWIPGGYPELHLDCIANNISMRNSLHTAVDQNKPILAECGGMMVLSKRLNNTAMFGLLEGHSVIQEKLQGLGTQHLEVDGAIIGAHTFHHGKFETPIQPSFSAKSKFGTGEAVYHHKSVTASFLHFYFPSNPQLTAQLFTL